MKDCRGFVYDMDKYLYIINKIPSESNEPSESINVLVIFKYYPLIFFISSVNFGSMLNTSPTKP